MLHGLISAGLIQGRMYVRTENAWSAGRLTTTVRKLADGFIEGFEVDSRTVYCTFTREAPQTSWC